MSIAVMTEVWKDAPVSGTELLMLLALADSANDDRECWPSQKHLQHKVRIGKSQAVKVLQSLERQELIVIHQKQGKGKPGMETNLYTINAMTGIAHDTTPGIAHDTTPGIAHDTTPGIAHDTLNHHIEPSIESLSPSGGDVPPKRIRPPHKNTAWHDALLHCFKLTPGAVTKSADRTYWTAASNLADIQFPVERIPEFYRWCKGQEWPSFTVMAMAKYAGEWLAKHQPHPAAPLDPAMDLSIQQPITPMFIKRRQEREGLA